jgi:hypothetical protein
VSYELIQDKWRDEDMDDAEEWETIEGQPVGPVTLEELLDFIDAEEVSDTITVEELLRRMGR